MTPGVCLNINFSKQPRLFGEDEERGDDHHNKDKKDNQNRTFQMVAEIDSKTVFTTARLRGRRAVVNKQQLRSVLGR